MGNRFPAVQCGATMVITLVVLLAMTLMAVSMMNNAILHELMAGNSRQKTVSRYVAEAALNQAEKTIVDKDFSVKSNMAPLFDHSAKGYYSTVNLSLVPGIIKTAVPVDFDITDMSAWNHTVNSVAVAGVIDTAITARPPQYIIEYIGQQQLDATLVQSPDRRAAIQRGLPYFFRVVAIGWGKDPEIYTILQSIYKLKPTLAVGDGPNKAEIIMIGAAIGENGRISWSIIH